MSDAHMWLVTKFGLRDTPDIPKVVCRSKGDAKRWIAEQDPGLIIREYDDDFGYFAAVSSRDPSRTRYSATRLPVAVAAVPATTTEEKAR